MIKNPSTNKNPVDKSVTAYWDDYFKNHPIGQKTGKTSNNTSSKGVAPTDESVNAYWDNYFKKQQSESSGNPVGKFVARTGKDLAAIVGGGLADTATTPYNLAATAQNLHRQSMDSDLYRAGASFSPDMPDMPYDTDIPLIPSATEAIDNKIDQATGGYTTTPEWEKPFRAALKSAVGLAIPGGFGKVANMLGYNGLGSFFNAIGSLKPSALAGAGAAGGTIEAAQQAGHSGGQTLAEGVGAGLVTDLILRKTPRAFVNLSGFGKKNLDLDGIEAAQRLPVDLPNSAFTNSPVAHLNTQTLGKMPFYGTWLRNNFTKASDDYKGALSNILDEVGPKKTEAIQKEISKRYQKMHESLPEMDTVKPEEILKTIQKFERQKSSKVPNSQLDVVRGTMKTLKDEITEEALNLPDGFKKLPRKVQLEVLNAIEEQTKLLDVPVSKLVDQKQNINATLRDKNVFNTNDNTFSKMLIAPKKAIDSELEKYGKKNPKFLKNMKAANRLHSDVEKREAFEKLLSSAKLDSKDEILYGTLSNVLGDKKNYPILENSLGKANFEKAKDLQEAAKSMKNIQKYNPNPSGTAIITLIGGMLASKGTTLTALGLSPIVYWTLSSKKFLNLATRYAKEPTAPLANQISDLFKRETGMTIQTANKIMHEQEEKD